MTTYTPKDFYNLRQWYGKWALRYFILHVGLCISFLMFSSEVYPYLISLITVSALSSHLHLWPAVRATLIANGETWRVSFVYFGLLIAWSMPIIIYLFPDYPNFSGNGAKLLFLFFLGPPVTLIETYMRLAKGEE